MLDRVKEYSRLVGFLSGVNPHKFTKENPHPVHGSNSDLWQRGKVYCTYKDPKLKQEAKTKKKKIRTTCSWFFSFTFDRQLCDYHVSQACMEHNHAIENVLVTPDGGITEITLDRYLIDSERDIIHQLARYNLPLSKVLTDINLPALY
jgi:hypothetical protein